MPINRDHIDPDELTSQVRTALAELEINGPNTLADLLPSEMLDDIEYEADAGQGGLITAADYRAYDAGLTIGRDEALGAMRGRIHSLGQTIPLFEEDRLRMRNDSEQALRSAIERMAKRAAKAVGIQVNVKRAEALSTGKLKFEGNGQNFTVDFGRRADFTTTVADLFSDDTKDPIGTLETLFEAYEAENGFLPDQMVTSSRVKRAFYRHPKITNMAFGRSDSGGRYAPEAAVDALLSQYDLPPFTVRGGKVKLRKNDGSEVVQNLLPDDSLILLPGSGDPAIAGSSDLGFTAYGTTLESQKSSWGISDQPGIVAAVHDNDTVPARMSVTALAIAMPVLVNPNYSLCAKVV
ncbi:major capsid protein [Rhodococcus phage Apiary]|nr:major capsid protein [Rhodococcus phage Braxoaddie]WNM64956.1 major capsid protein [Rhodococcus phage Maselop]WNM67417.1 major capsid protein [Rhodococcus phage Polyyuki]WNM69841.1 major capsid protein [Rhodococcus phage Apiary]